MTLNPSNTSNLEQLTSKGLIRDRCFIVHATWHSVVTCDSDDKDEFVVLKNWTDGGNHAFIRSCIAADADRGLITVRYGGHYVFYDHLAVCRCAGNLEFRQRIYRRPANGGDDMILLQDSRAGGYPRGGEGCVGEPPFSSDLFAVVRLEDGDSVWISVKPASAVYRPNDASFFGLYRLPLL